MLSTAGTMIGDPQEFAIEYRISRIKPDLMGYMRLWLRGRYVGSWEDENILGVAAGQLRWFVEKRLWVGGGFMDAITPDRCEVLNEDECSQHWIVCLGEQFDDFLIRGFKTDDDRVCWFWRLFEKPFFDYPGYPLEWQVAVMAAKPFENVVRQYVEMVDRLHASEETAPLDGHAPDEPHSGT